MDTTVDLATANRVMHLLRHLGIERAHFALGTEIAAKHPEAVASLALLLPGPAEVVALRALGERGRGAIPTAVVYGDRGARAGSAAAVLAACPDAAATALRDYEAVLWADVAADRPDEIGAALLAHLAAAECREPLPPLQLSKEEGEVAGITYRARGSGPPLLLFPILLAPSQWEPLVPLLAEHYCTLTLGGPHLGFVGLLEQRACGGYGTIVAELSDAVAPPAGGSVLEVGCGAGAVACRVARRTGPATRVVGADINAYLLREAAAMARREGLAGRVAFREGNAEALPFPDDSFDAALSCTMLEEVDADHALAELVRVVRPGGRIAVAVRAGDIPYWDTLPLRPELRAKFLARKGSGAAPRGCADASLYRRFRTLGLTAVGLGPRLAIDRPEDNTPDWRASSEAGMEAALDPSEVSEWQAALARAEVEGSLLWGMCYHCAVGTKP